MHPNQVTAWENYLVTHVAELFEDNRCVQEKDQAALTPDTVYDQGTQGLNALNDLQFSSTYR